MIELFEELHTCADVRALADWGVGEGLRMDYKEEIRLTRGGRKELAKDVSALADAEGGLLVVGIMGAALAGGRRGPEGHRDGRHLLVDPHGRGCAVGARLCRLVRQFVESVVASLGGAQRYGPG